MSRADPAAGTAVGPMVLAAVEQHEPPGRRLVDDDLAASFLPTVGRWFAAATRLKPLRRLLIGAVDRSGPGLWTNLACRKRYIDEKLAEALPDLDAVVILGAGLDTRGCRLARHSDIPVYEVDQPVNVARKAATIRRVFGAVPSTVHLVPVDFERDDLAESLRQNGYRDDARTLFIWEGVTQYLTADAVRGTLAQLQTPGSRLVFTYVRSDFIDGTNLYGAKSLHHRFVERRPIWTFGLRPDDVEAFLREFGWHLVEQAGPDYLVERYVRPTGRTLAASQIEWSAFATR